jgi:uncharacterized membrane protein
MIQIILFILVESAVFLAAIGVVGLLTNNILYGIFYILISLVFFYMTTVAAEYYTKKEYHE